MPTRLIIAFALIALMAAVAIVGLLVLIKRRRAAREILRGRSHYKTKR